MILSENESSWNRMKTPLRRFDSVRSSHWK